MFCSILFFEHKLHTEITLKDFGSGKKYTMYKMGRLIENRDFILDTKGHRSQQSKSLLGMEKKKNDQTVLRLVLIS